MSAENRAVHKTPGKGVRADTDNSRGYRQIDPRAEHISDQRESSSADNSAGDSARHSTAGIQATPKQTESQAAFTITGIQTSNSNTGIQVAKHRRGFNPGEKHHRDSGLRPAPLRFAPATTYRGIQFATAESWTSGQRSNQ
jgi:hypothetical protein